MRSVSGSGHKAHRRGGGAAPAAPDWLGMMLGFASSRLPRPCWSAPRMRLDFADFKAVPWAWIVASVTATSDLPSISAACSEPSARATSALASARAVMDRASALPWASIFAAFAFPRALVSYCCASAAATAPLASAVINSPSAGRAEMMLIESTSTPYRIAMSLACVTASRSLSTSKSRPTSSCACVGGPGSGAAAHGCPSTIPAAIPVTPGWTEDCPVATAVAAEKVSEKLTRPTKAEREASACFRTSLRSFAMSPTDPFGPFIVSAARSAQHCESRMCQHTVASTVISTLSPVMALIRFRSSVWIFLVMNFSNFQLRWFSRCTSPPGSTCCCPLFCVTAS
eukprot:Hpha_TRINITY_DN15231_c1_g14::TRINITY_DN15231_c1_g14_i1::g.67655::m.67655